MSDALGKAEESSKKVFSAIRTVKVLRDKNLELQKMIEIANTYAGEIEKLKDLPAELTEERDLRDKLKQELQNMLNYWSKVSVQHEKLRAEIQKNQIFLTERFTGSTIPPEVIKQFCEELRNLNDLAMEFYDLFEEFVGFLSDSQLLAEKLTNKLKQRLEEAERVASSSRNKGIAKTVGLTVLGTALVALGFFTGGATLAAAGAVGGAACGVGAGVVAYNSVVDVNTLWQKANDIKDCFDKLDVIVNELENRVDTALHLDEEMTAALQNLLAFAISDQQKDNQIAQLQREKTERDIEIARLQRENNELKQKRRWQGNI